ncbi:MAG TPA: polysaccharide biosynthesis protein, partial [Marmoricola sp.]|nr:polysaccharide biosynthesis protein [Marmoricola sp.]
SIALAIAVMNVATYAYTLVAARLLGPRSYGAFAAVMGLLLVVGVLQLGLQATGARRIAAHPEDVAEIEHNLRRVTWGASIGLALLCLVLTPVINAALHLDSLATASLVALVALPMTLMGGQAGILQGERRWTALALVYLAAGVPRLVVGTAFLLWRPTEFWAVMGVAIGFVAPTVVGWLALRDPRSGHVPDTYGGHGGWSVLRETARNSHALFAFFALSNADVIVARSVLDAHESGLYAGGLILVKAVLFLPQFVVVVAFPSMSTESARRSALLRSVGAVMALGVVGTVAAWLFSGLTLTFIGGQEYAAIQDQLWRFAALGSVLSVLQLLVYGVVARQSRWSVYLIWAALVVLVLWAQVASTVGELLNVVTFVDSMLLVVLLGLSMWRLGVRTPPGMRQA